MAGGWDGNADAYARSFARLCAGTVPAIIERLGPGHGRLLLDIGTGTGTVAAAAHHNGDTVVGMDSDHSMTTLAADRHRQISFVRGALPQLPCADESFDVITANFVVNHASDPRAAVSELFRCTRVGGQLVATIWPSETTALNQLWNEVMAAAEVTPPAGTRLAPELDFERTADGFADLVAQAGFQDVDCQEIGWTFTIRPDELWVAVEAGIAVIGRTYRTQDPAGRQRMRAAYDAITEPAHGACGLQLPSVALVATADRR